MLLMSMVPWKSRISSSLLSQLMMRKRRSRTRGVRKHSRKVKKRNFYRCKAKCACSGFHTAKGLKECTVCRQIKKTACSKDSCCIDGIKPKMIRKWNMNMSKIVMKLITSKKKKNVMPLKRKVAVLSKMMILKRRWW